MPSLSPDALRGPLERVFQGMTAVPVGRAALGLVAVLRAWSSGGGIVAMPSIICHDVLAAVLEAGFSPLFCDVDPMDGNVPEGEWLRARAAGATVGLVAHLYGNPAATSVARRAFPTGDFLLIDDAAQALGAMTDRGVAGAQGDVGLVSFGRTKQIDAGGGAAVLARDPVAATQIARQLELISVAAETERAAAFERFIVPFNAARNGLVQRGAAAAPEFRGLLHGYGPVLRVPFAADAVPRILQGLVHRDALLAARREKAEAWRAGLGADTFVPVGMGESSSPWRYACRLPAANFAIQRHVGDRLRAAGIDVSHWYLPSHWFVDQDHHGCKLAQRFAGEVFQFWVDDDTSLETIRHSAATAREIVVEFGESAGPA